MANTDAEQAGQIRQAGLPQAGGAICFQARTYLDTAARPDYQSAVQLTTHQRIYQGVPVIAATQSLLYLRALASGSIRNSSIHLPANVTGSAAVFNIRKNGVTLFSTGQRPTISAGQSSVITNDLAFAVLKGDELTLDVDDPSTSGLTGPLVWTFDVQ